MSTQTYAKKVLALSSSRVGTGGFLQDAIPYITNFLGDSIKRIAFIPFASVQRDYEVYGKMLTDAMESLPYSIDVVTPENAIATIENADAIITGGGNTFKLLHDLYQLNLFQLLQNKINQGSPYIGWSAGANITGRSISTTNDMPIVEPQSFKALNAFPFQINPHYFNQPIEGHNGETRDQRLAEFIIMNPEIPVVGLPEGTGLILENNQLKLIGQRNAILFQNNNGKEEKTEISNSVDLNYLMNA